jgi:hypothetical protein
LLFVPKITMLIKVCVMESRVHDDFMDH